MGESKHPSHPLGQRSDPGGDAPCKRHQTCPTRPPSVREATVRCRFSPPLSPLRIFFFSAFFRDFPLIFRWKAVVDSVQFRVILNITTKRFGVASWHAEMLRFGRRPTAADAASRNDPSRENAFGALRGCATMKAPVGLSSGRAVCVSRWRGLNPDKLRRARQTRIKNNSSAAIARAKRRQFQIVHPTNERSLTTLESTTP